MKKQLLKERLQKLAGIKPLYTLKEQISSNPFTGGGSGPNWQAAEQAWEDWNNTNQGGAPQPDAVFLNNMDGKGCGFYEKRLEAQVNSFVNQFGASFGQAGSSNPAWQSQKYARIMWLANKVQNDCSGTTTGQVGMFFNYLNDPANDGPLDSAQCANGNQAISAQNKASMKFRHQSMSDCGMLQNKIDAMSAAATNATGCAIIRKQAKLDYLTQMQASVC